MGDHEVARRPPGTGLQLLESAYAAITAVVTDLSEDDAGRPTRTAWTVRELLFHLLLDAQRALMAFASPTDDPPDVDEVTYWAPFVPGTDQDAEDDHLRFVRASAAAYPSMVELVRHWRETSQAAVRAARATTYADRVGRVTTQGHALTVEDFVSTLVLEASVHLLDLTLELPGEVPPAASTLVRDVLEQILGSPLPPEWDDTTAVLKGTGRVPLDDADRRALGGAADRLPLLG